MVASRALEVPGRRADGVRWRPRQTAIRGATEKNVPEIVGAEKGGPVGNLIIATVSPCHIQILFLAMLGRISRNHRNGGDLEKALEDRPERMTSITDLHQV